MGGPLQGSPSGTEASKVRSSWSVRNRNCPTNVRHCPRNTSPGRRASIGLAVRPASLLSGAEPTIGDYFKWLNEVADEIDELIWPKYIPGSMITLTADMRALLDADFLLLHRLRKYFGYPIEYPGHEGLPTTVQHCDFFEQEDNVNVAFGSGYDRYDASLSAEIYQNLPTIMTAGIADCGRRSIVNRVYGGS
jgi:hypothetical protein